MKKIILSISISLLIISCNEKSIESNSEVITEIKDKNSEINSLIELLEISNTLNGITSLKKDIDISNEKYNIDFIIETYENDSLIEKKNIFSGRSFHQVDSIQTVYMNQLILAVKRGDSKADDFTFSYGNNINKVSNKISINPKYLRPFGLMAFKKPETIELNKVIPFAIYGAFWEFDFNGTKMLRFCSDKLKSRTDEQVYGKSPYYFIFSYQFHR